MKTISIIGSGPAGASLAVLLARTGHIVDVFEKRGSVGQTSEGFPSIQLLISPRGQHVIQQLGLWSEFLKYAFPLTGRLKYYADNNTAFIPYGRRTWINYAIDRNILAQIIFNLAAQTPGVTIHTEHTLKDISESLIFDTNGTQKTYPKGDLVIGADGAHSKVREVMERQNELVTVHTEKFSHVYTQVSLTKDQIPTEALHAINIWSRTDHCMVGMPDSPKSLKCTLILPSTVTEDAYVLENFLKESFPSLCTHMTNLRFADLYRIKLNSYYDPSLQTILIGDAAHTILPFMGQGVNLGLEESLLLSECISNSKNLESFATNRVKEGHAADILSAEHYGTITRSNFQRKTFLGSVTSFIKRIFHLETPLAVVQLDFKQVAYSSLVDNK